MSARQRYIVASSPRTGSYLLCEGLEATGIAGRPTEVFSPAFQYVWREQWSLGDDCSFEEYLRAALEYGTTPNGVYGLKIHWIHVANLAQDAQFAGESGEVLEHLFGGARYVNIVRRDRRAQAVSYFRALATNEWWRIDGVDNPQKNHRKPQFDADAIVEIEGALEQQEQAWQRFFRSRSIVPLTVEYETLTRDYRGEIARVLAFLGLDASRAQRIPGPRLVRQSDETTEHWRRLMVERAARGSVDP